MGCIECASLTRLPKHTMFARPIPRVLKLSRHLDISSSFGLSLKAAVYNATDILRTGAAELPRSARGREGVNRLIAHRPRRRKGKASCFALPKCGTYSCMLSSLARGIAIYGPLTRLAHAWTSQLQGSQRLVYLPKHAAEASPRKVLR